MDEYVLLTTILRTIILWLTVLQEQNKEVIKRTRCCERYHLKFYVSTIISYQL